MQMTQYLTYLDNSQLFLKIGLLLFYVNVHPEM